MRASGRDAHPYLREAYPTQVLLPFSTCISFSGQLGVVGKPEAKQA